MDAGSEYKAKQLKNRLKVAMLADVIVPGHGGKFAVTEPIRIKLRKDAETLELSD